MIRIALDTNILVYNVGIVRHADDIPKTAAVRALFRGLRGRSDVIVPVQALGELYRVLTRAGEARPDARAVVLGSTDGLTVADSTSSGFLSAMDLATDHKLQIWDALILNTAAEAGCAMLLSEDMGEGFTWRGTTIVNPLADHPDERLTRVLA